MTRPGTPLVLGLTAAALSAGLGSAPNGPPPPTRADEHVIAMVLGRKLTDKDKGKLDGLIFGALLDRFASENRIEPTEEEINTFTLKMDEQARQHQVEFERQRQKLIGELKSPSLSDQERKEKEAQLQTLDRVLKATREMNEPHKGMEVQLAAIKRDVARNTVRTWKINKALYKEYGGRVIFQQAGVEPLDAYRDFLKEQERKGAFQILDKGYEAAFWKYFTDDSMHTFYSKDDGAKLINTPWWLTDASPKPE